MTTDNDKLPDEFLTALERIDEVDPQETDTDTPDSVEESAVHNAVDEDVVNEETDESPSDSTGWWNEQDLALGQSYGLTEEEVQSFKDADDFRLATRILDQRLLAPKPQDAGQAGASTSDQEQPKTESSFDRIRLNPDEYDEELVKAFDAIQDRLENALGENKTVREQLDEIRQIEEHRIHMQQVQQFDNWMDELAEEYGAQELIGKGQGLNNLQLHNRQKLWSSLGTLLTAAQQNGQTASFSKEMAARTFNFEFYDHIEKLQQRTQASRIAKQSQKRLGGGDSTRERNKVWNGDDPSQDPVLHDLFRQMERQSGAK